MAGRCTVSFRCAIRTMGAGAPKAHACRIGVSISRGDSVGAELREKKGRLGIGIPWPALLAYNLFKSQWYIQWLRTLRNRGSERFPQKDRKPVGGSTLTGFFHVENRDVTRRGRYRLRLRDRLSQTDRYRSPKSWPFDSGFYTECL